MTELSERPRCPATKTCPLYPSFCIRCTPAFKSEQELDKLADSGEKENTEEDKATA
jgi:hypothetical protein